MVPDAYKREAAPWWRNLATALLLCLAAGNQAVAEERGLTQVVYEFAVTSYCGSLNPAVEAGFRRELAALTARGGFDAESARRQRIRGWVLAEEEWRNRGLGGQRAWCREEGLAAARHFQAIARNERQP